MFWTVTSSLLEGFGTSIEIFTLTLIFSIPLGLIVAFGSMSRIAPIRFIFKLIVWVIRGTPLMLQLIFVFYVPGLIVAWAEKQGDANFFIEILSSLKGFDRFTAVIVSFVINYACYFSEIYRGGIESIPVGQYEACHVLGMTKSQAFFKVVLLQVIKRILPPMGNEIITLVKDTSLSRTISVYEIVFSAQSFITMNGLIWPLLYTGVFYLIFNGALTILFAKIEKKMDYFRG